MAVKIEVERSEGDVKINHNPEHIWLLLWREIVLMKDKAEASAEQDRDVVN